MRASCCRALILCCILLACRIGVGHTVKARVVSSGQQVFLYKPATRRNHHRNSYASSSSCHYSSRSAAASMLGPHRRRRHHSFRNTLLAASRRKKNYSVQTTTKARQPSDSLSKDTVAVSLDELPLAAKVIARSLELAIVFGMEYVQGFVSGYLLGTVTGVPSLLFKSTEAQARLSAQVTSRFARMNAKSLNWGKQWAAISAIFGGFHAGTRLVRGGVEDEWNGILSSAAAGAYFSKNGGPVAMARGAVLYGGITYLLSVRKSPQERLENSSEVEF